MVIAVFSDNGVGVSGVGQKVKCSTGPGGHVRQRQKSGMKRRREVVGTQRGKMTYHLLATPPECNGAG